MCLASLLAAAGLFTHLQSSHAQTRPPAGLVELPEELPFELTVTPINPMGGRPAGDRTVQIEPGGYIGLSCELKYTGDEPVTIFWGRAALTSATKLNIQTPLGRKVVTSSAFPAPQPHAARKQEIVTLQPGETVRGNAYTGSRTSRLEFYFREPGRYSLTTSLKLYEATGDPEDADAWALRGTITAPATSFEVKPREGVPDQKWRRVHGRITDEEGKPVPQADVYVLVERTAMQSPMMEKRFRIHDRAVTDEKGHYEFLTIPAAEPRLMLGALHHTHPPAEKILTVDPASDDQQVDLSLPPGRTVTGTVVDTESRPLAGVGIGRPHVHWKYTPHTLLTGADGRFTMEGLPTTKTYVQAHRRDLEIADRSHNIDDGTGLTTTTIVMQPRSASTRTLTGTARFDNGQPAGDLELTLWIDRKDGGSMRRTCITDGAGRFSHEIPRQFAPDDVPLTGRAEAAPPPERVNPRTGELERAKLGSSFVENHVPRSRWMTRFDVPAGRDEIELEFDRRHTLDLEITQAVPLPDSLAVTVSLAAKVNHSTRQIARETLSADRLTDLDYRDLTPGTYQAQVRCDDFEYHLRWEGELTIPFDTDQTSHELEIDIPEIGFGSLKVPIRNADGSKPADGLSLAVSIDGHRVRQRQPVINGVATWPLVPAGEVYASYEGKGVLALAVRGEVRAGEETVLDPLIIRSEDEIFGRVAGRVLLADGAPALGTSVLVSSTGLFGSIGLMPLGGHGGVDGSGRFGVRGRPGEQLPWLQVMLSGCDLWPPGSATDRAERPSFGFNTSDPFDKQHRSLFVPTELIAGQERTQDIVLPDVTFRDVTIDVPLEKGQQASVTAWTDLGQARHLRTQRGFSEGPAVLEHVPDRPTRLFLTIRDRTGPFPTRQRYSAVLTVPEGDAAKVRVDPSQVGQVQVHARLPAGDDGERVSWSVRPDKAILPSPLTSVGGVFNTQPVDEVTWRLAPGRYTVSLRRSGEVRERTIEVDRGEQQQVEFDFTAPAEPRED